MMSGRSSSASSVAQLGHQGQVPGGQRVDPDHVHVGLHGLPRHLGRGLEQRADVDVEAQVGERGGDHLLAAVVAVLAHLGDQDARLAALGLGERVDQLAGAGDRRAGPGFLGVHPGDDPDLAGVPPEDLLQRVGDLADGGLRPGRVAPTAPAGSARRCAALALGDQRRRPG